MPIGETKIINRVATKLFYVASKKPDELVEFVNTLPYKIEVKSGPTFASGRFYLFYILPDDYRGTVFSGVLDG